MITLYQTGSWYRSPFLSRRLHLWIKTNCSILTTCRRHLCCLLPHQAALVASQVLLVQGAYREEHLFQVDHKQESQRLATSDWGLRDTQVSPIPIFLFLELRIMNFNQLIHIAENEPRPINRRWPR